MTLQHTPDRSQDVPTKLKEEGRWHLLPLYYLCKTSFMGREGIRNGGSPAFADHVYQNEARGHSLFGRIVDWCLLRLRASRSMRNRYIRAKEEIREHVMSNKDATVLSVPSGYARELHEVATELRDHPRYESMTLFAIDLDKEVLESIPDTHDIAKRQGDALQRSTYQDIQPSMVVSTGFTEFLDDEQAQRFFTIVHEALQEGGRFVTSGMQPQPMADYLLRNLADINTSYRGPEALQSMADKAGFSTYHTERDDHGLQTVLTARK